MISGAGSTGRLAATCHRFYDDTRHFLAHSRYSSKWNLIKTSGCQVKSFLNTNDVFRTVIAGYGEPTTHPGFMEFVSAIGGHPGRFDMVSNGQLLDEKKLKHLDGKINLLVISFSSINTDVYRSVHVKLDHEKVKANIILARRVLKKTSLTISLTPLVECIETLPETIRWFHKQGIEQLTMSPTRYNRAGTMEQHKHATERLREIIRAIVLETRGFYLPYASAGISRHLPGPVVLPVS